MMSQSPFGKNKNPGPLGFAMPGLPSHLRARSCKPVAGRRHYYTTKGCAVSSVIYGHSKSPSYTSHDGFKNYKDMRIQ